MKSWLSSPLAINYLLSLCKTAPSNLKTYLQIYKDLKIKEEYLTSSKLFLTSSKNESQYETSDVGVQVQESKDTSKSVMKWINQYGNFGQMDIERYVGPSSVPLLCNISMFKGTWKGDQSSPLMKVHNSFNYTQDINYEARLIELPMQGDEFKLVLVVPNQLSSVERLFSVLVGEGMEAAVGCVRPLFSFTTVLEAPSIKFSSTDRVSINKNNCDVIKCVQVGNVHINDAGTDISVLTMLSSSDENRTDAAVEVKESVRELPYYFAVLYKDTAIFSGRYVKRIK